MQENHFCVQLHFFLFDKRNLFYNIITEVDRDESKQARDDKRQQLNAVVHGKTNRG